MKKLGILASLVLVPCLLWAENINVHRIDSFYWDNNWDKYLEQLRHDSVFSPNQAYAFSLDINSVEYDEQDKRFHEVIIKHQGEEILRLRGDAWTNSSFAIRDKKSEFYSYVTLSDTKFALVFYGWSYASQASMLTIVLFDKDKAELLFNQYTAILSHTNTAKKFEILYSTEIQQFWQDENGQHHAQPHKKDMYYYRLWREKNKLRLKSISFEEFDKLLGEDRESNLIQIEGEVPRQK